MSLLFNVKGQNLSVGKHPPVVADSRNYLVATFAFSEDWNGVTKTAVFKGRDDTVYHVLLENDACAVPPEVIAAPHFRVSVFGGDRITADSVTVEVLPSGCEEGVTPPTPTPDIYDQLVQEVAEQRALAQQAASAAAASAQEAEQAVSTGGVQVDNTVTANGENAVSGAAVYGFVAEKTAAVYRYKGTVATYLALNSIATKEIGDVYNVSQDGMNVAWTGTAWDKLGATIPVNNAVEGAGANAVSGFAVTNFVNQKLTTKQDALTFDGTPTADSSNPVTSGGVYAALEAVQDGTDGESAYQLAVDNGYTGTVTEWLASLHGADGANGSDGTNGQDGADGADGADGVSPTVVVTEITGGHAVAITDANGTQTFDVMDGMDGGGGVTGGADASWAQIGYVSADTDGLAALNCICTANTYTEYMVLIYAAQAAVAGNIACRINSEASMQFLVPAKTNGGFYSGIKITRSPFGSFVVSGAAVAAYNSNYANSFGAFDSLDNILMAMNGGMPAGTSCTVWGRF